VDATEQLSLIAELGVAFVGFLAIFIIFARREGRFSPADSLRVLVIFQTGFVCIFMALLPLLIALSEIESATVWRASSFVYLAANFFCIVAVGRRQLALAASDRAEVGTYNNLIAWGLTLLSNLLLVANVIGVLGDPSALPYVAALVGGLGIATSNFATIAVQRIL
jgi:uncharacterized membrane protein